VGAKSRKGGKVRRRWDVWGRWTAQEDGPIARREEEQRGRDIPRQGAEIKVLRSLKKNQPRESA
jgi:hypothetical protein